MFVTYKCPKCGEEKIHPSIIRSIPWCEACFIPMERKRT